ncbi:MAG: HNH endonuclease [Gaiellales bacterium]
MKHRTWKDDDLKQAVQESTSLRQIMRRLNLKPVGGNYALIKKYIRILSIDSSHLKGHAWNKGLRGTYRPPKPINELLVDGIDFWSHGLKRRLIAEGLKPSYCEECGWSVRTPEGHLPLEIHHINGNSRDNRLENLQILCPNCHSLKPYYRARKLKIPASARVV